MLVDLAKSHAVDPKESLKLSLDSRQPWRVYKSYSGWEVRGRQPRC